MVVRCEELVGRDPETRRIREFVDRAASGRAEVLVLRGPAGIGKTRLTELLMSLVDEAGGRSLRGRAVPDSTVPFRMLTEVVLDAMTHGAKPSGPGLDDHHRTLHRLLGDDGDPGDDEPPTDAPSHPLVAADAVLRLASTLSGATIIVLEDLHWADPDTVRSFEYLSDHAASRTIGLVTTVRSDQPSDALAVLERLRARHAVEIVDLAPLDRAAVERMIALCLGEEPPRRLVDAIESRAEGRPLVVEELLGALTGDTGDTDRHSIDRAVERDEADLVAMTPPSLVESVERRLDRLERDHRRLVVLAAALGIDVDLGLLERLAMHGLGIDDPGEGVAEADRAMLVESAGGRLRFRHALTRDAVLASSAASELPGIAARALVHVGTLSDLADAHLEAWASLAGQAGDPATTRLRLEAGQRALRRGALRSAGHWLELARRGADDDYDLRAEVSASLVEFLAHTGRVADAVREGEAALRMAAARSDAATSTRIQLALIRADVNAERWQAALDRLAALDRGPSHTASAMVLEALALLGAARLDEAFSSALRVVELLDGEVEPMVACEAYEVLGRIARTSDLDEAATWFERGLRTAEKAGLRSWRARALHEVATLRQLDTGLVDLHERALEAATEAGASSVRAAVLFHLGALHGVQFESARALEEGRLGLDLARRLGTRRQEAMAWIIIGQAHAAAGRELQARAAAAEAIAAAPGDLEVHGLAGGACAGLALAVNERRSEALVEIDTAARQLERLPSRTPVSTWYLWPLFCAVEGGDAAHALAITDVPELRVARGFDALWLVAAAVDAGRRGEPAEANALLAAALAQFDRCPGFVGYRHLSLRHAGEAALDDGWADPAPWFTAGAEWFAEAGLTRPEQACRSLARMAGVPERRRRGAPVPTGLAALGVTAREVDVLSLLPEGLTNRELGARLYISPRTVKTHIEHLLTKTGSTNRAQLAALAISELDLDSG